MDDKQRVTISSYSDLAKLRKDLKCVHFRKFLSKRLLSEILSVCENISSISLSRYAYAKCNKELIESIKRKGISIIIRKCVGRPNLMERW